MAGGVTPSYTVMAFTQDVVWLQISVGDAVSMEEVKGRGHLTDHLASFSLSETFLSLNVSQEMTTKHSVKHQAELVIILKEFH